MSMFGCEVVMKEDNYCKFFFCFAICSGLKGNHRTAVGIQLVNVVDCFLAIVKKIDIPFVLMSASLASLEDNPSLIFIPMT